MDLSLFLQYKESNHCKIREDITTFLHSKRGKSREHTYIGFLNGLDEEMDYTSNQAIDKFVKANYR